MLWLNIYIITKGEIFKCKIYSDEIFVCVHTHINVYAYVYMVTISNIVFLIVYLSFSAIELDLGF
jgi:hypothetical protein